MGQRRNDTAAEDVHIRFRQQEWVISMGQRSNDAAAMDAQITL